MYAKINAEAKNVYMEALREILNVAPADKEKAANSYTEDEKPDVEFNMKDMKFLNLTLKDSIIFALKNNYDIRISKMDPMIKDKDITAAKSVFDPILKITGETEDSEVPSNSQLQIGFGGQLSDFRRDRNTLNATTEKLLETGATFTLGFILEQQFLDPSPFAFFNPFATSSIEAKVTQPS